MISMPLKKTFQTFDEFMRMPFNTDSQILKNAKYNALYNEYISKNKIYIAGYTEIEDSYYVHIKVPSDSLKDGKYEYDVVIRFFTDDPKMKHNNSLSGYYIQFFSNSPGFIYRYAVLYKKYHFLIEELYDKMDPEFKDKMLEKTNPNSELSYDKTIYFACKFISDRKFRILNKKGLLLQKKMNPDKFFMNISDFRSVKMDRELIKAESDLKKQLEIAKKNDRKRKADAHRKFASGSTRKNNPLNELPPSIKRVVKKVATGRKGKIRAKKSTRKTR